MTAFDTVIQHINLGVTYSWDYTQLRNLEIPLPAPLRENLLHSAATADDAALVTSLYVGKLLRNQPITPVAGD